jgi:hypothetical protein
VAEKQLNDLYCKQVEPLQKIMVEAEAQTVAGLRAKATVVIDWYCEGRKSPIRPGEKNRGKAAASTKS